MQVPTQDTTQVNSFKNDFKSEVIGGFASSVESTLQYSLGELTLLVKGEKETQLSGTITETLPFSYADFQTGAVTLPKGTIAFKTIDGKLSVEFPDILLEKSGEFKAVFKTTKPLSQKDLDSASSPVFKAISEVKEKTLALPIDVLGTTLLFPQGNLTIHYSTQGALVTALITTPNENFSGKAVFKFPFEYSDYEKGLLEITPKPSQVLPGLIVIYQGLELKPGQQMQLSLKLKKKPEAKTFSQAFVPVFKAQEKTRAVSVGSINAKSKALKQNSLPVAYLAFFAAAIALFAFLLKKKLMPK